MEYTHRGGGGGDFQSQSSKIQICHLPAVWPPRGYFISQFQNVIICKVGIIIVATLLDSEQAHLMPCPSGPVGECSVCVNNCQRGFNPSLVPEMGLSVSVSVGRGSLGQPLPPHRVERARSVWKVDVMIKGDSQQGTAWQSSCVH